MQMPVEVKTIDKEQGTLEAIFSTQDVDRHGDVVLQEGWDLKNFKKNPVILDSHNYESATEVIGRAFNVRIESKKLIGEIEFAIKENPKAKIIFDLYAEGYLHAFSVGFIPSKFKQNKDGTTDWYTIEEAELLEVSAVSVPANARALAKSKGIDVDLLNKENDDEKVKEDEDESGSKKPGSDDALSKDNEIQTDDEEADTENGDGGESGQKKSDDEAGKDTEDGEDKEVVADEEEEEDPIEEKSKRSYASKVVQALGRMELKEKKRYQKAAEIIKSLIDSDKTLSHIDRKIKDQIKKRKINQAIRLLTRIN